MKLVQCYNWIVKTATIDLFFLSMSLYVSNNLSEEVAKRHNIDPKIDKPLKPDYHNLRAENKQLRQDNERLENECGDLAAGFRVYEIPTEYLIETAKNLTGKNLQTVFLALKGSKLVGILEQKPESEFDALEKISR